MNKVHFINENNQTLYMDRQCAGIVFFFPFVVLFSFEELQGENHQELQQPTTTTKIRFN